MVTKPISIVAPSPPIAITLVSFFLPRAFRATSIPEATAPAFFKKGVNPGDLPVR